MNATETLESVGASSFRGTVGCLVLASTLAIAGPAAADGREAPGPQDHPNHALPAPDHGKIPVAFLVSEGAQVIDWAGPWEVFQDVMIRGRGDGTHLDAHPFELFTVAESREPIPGTGGLRIVPDYTFDDAPTPRVIVVPAQGGVTPALLDWLRKASAEADVTMSVCTGAFILAKAGLLSGAEATTHHAFLDLFEQRYPQVKLRRDARWVEGPRVATAAGLTSGIDLALRTVERYFGPETAARTAEYMEHPSDGWRLANGRTFTERDERLASASPAPRPALQGHDPVRLTRGDESPGDPEISEVHDGYRYQFHDEATRNEFRSDPSRYAIQLRGACAAMGVSGAEPGSGDPSVFYVHEGRIYIFASDHCRSDFMADPEAMLAGGTDAAEGEGS